MAPASGDGRDEVLGTWDVGIATPIGTLAAVYAFHELDDGGLGGSATSRHEQVPLQDVVVSADPDGHRVTWRQSITRPLRLHLTFDVTVTDGVLTGHSRAGRLPRSAVRGAKRHLRPECVTEVRPPTGS